MNNATDSKIVLIAFTFAFIGKKHGVTASQAYAAYQSGNAKVIAQYNELMGRAWKALRGEVA